MLIPSGLLDFPVYWGRDAAELNGTAGIPDVLTTIT